MAETFVKIEFSLKWITAILTAPPEKKNRIIL